MIATDNRLRKAAKRMAHAMHYIEAALNEMRQGGAEIAGADAARIRQLMRWSLFAAGDAEAQIKSTLDRKEERWKTILESRVS